MTSSIVQLDQIIPVLLAMNKHDLQPLLLFFVLDMPKKN